MHQTSAEKSFYSTGSGLQKSFFLCYRSIVFISAFRAIRALDYPNIVLEYCPEPVDRAEHFTLCSL